MLLGVKSEHYTGVAEGVGATSTQEGAKSKTVRNASASKQDNATKVLHIS